MASPTKHKSGKTSTQIAELVDAGAGPAIMALQARNKQMMQVQPKVGDEVGYGRPHLWGTLLYLSLIHI